MGGGIGRTLHLAMSTLESEVHTHFPGDGMPGLSVVSTYRISASRRPGKK